MSAPILHTHLTGITAMQIAGLPECPEHEYDEDWAEHNADAFLRTANEIRALPETGENDVR